MLDGPVTPATQLLKVVSEELQPILQDIDKGGVVAVWGPTQTGKTTLLYALEAHLRAHRVPVVYVTCEGIVFKDDGVDAAWEKINKKIASRAQIAPDRAARSLSSPNWMAHAFKFPTPPVLIIDEFAQLTKAPKDVCTALTQGLRALLKPDNNHHSAIRSLVVAGPRNILEHFTTPTEELSRWLATHPHRMAGFTFADVRLLFDEFCEEFPVIHRCPVTDDVIRAILSLTGGHRGLTVQSVLS